MISLIDIQNSVTLKLMQEFNDSDIIERPKIRVEDNREGVNPTGFYVSVRPLQTTSSMHHMNRLVNVDVTYISKNNTHRENLIMTEELEYLFHLNLEVLDEDKRVKRKPYIKSLNIREVNDVLICGFTLDFNQGFRPEKVSDIEYNDYMKQLHVQNIEGND